MTKDFWITSKQWKEAMTVVGTCFRFRRTYDCSTTTVFVQHWEYLFFPQEYAHSS